MSEQFCTAKHRSCDGNVSFDPVDCSYDYGPCAASRSMPKRYASKSDTTGQGDLRSEMGTRGASFPSTSCYSVHHRCQPCSQPKHFRLPLPASTKLQDVFQEVQQQPKACRASLKPCQYDLRVRLVYHGHRWVWQTRDPRCRQQRPAATLRYPALAR